MIEDVAEVEGMRDELGLVIGERRLRRHRLIMADHVLDRVLSRAVDTARHFAAHPERGLHLSCTIFPTSPRSDPGPDKDRHPFSHSTISGGYTVRGGGVGC